MQGPSLAGYPGLQFQLQSYYDNRALEENAACTSPRMQVSAFKVVEDTPARIVLDVRYHYSDDSHRDNEINQFGLAAGGGRRASTGRTAPSSSPRARVARRAARRPSRWCR